MSVWCRGRASALLLHLVDDDAPVIELPNGVLVRFGLCNLSVDPWPPSEDDRAVPHCAKCICRSLQP